MAKSIKRLASTALKQDVKDRAVAQKKSAKDSFVNFQMNLGIGSDNPLTGGTYGFNPVTRVRPLLDWIHRGSWLGGVAVDVVADDMTRAGVELVGEMEPDKIAQVEEKAVQLNIWGQLNDTIKWSRLYGGCIAVMLIDGQDPETPLRPNTIKKDQFCGLLVLDRWMVEPSLGDLITELGPNLGLPKYYRVTAQAPALMNQKIHYTRCIRLEGIRLPYWQRLTENLWGLSVLERLYDRMIAFDSATTGAAQLVYKSYLRTMKVKDLREVASEGGDALVGLTKYVDMMRRFQGIEGITLIDAEDEFGSETHSAFGGLSDALQQFAQQLSGALQIPLVRLFGQSPIGFSTGETDLRNYYDTIRQQQESQLKVGVTNVYRALVASEGLDWPEGMQVKFKDLWQTSSMDKATIAQTSSQAVLAAEEAGVIDKGTALRELHQIGQITGIFTNVTEEAIQEADEEEPPMPENEVAPENTNEKAAMQDALPEAAGICFISNSGKILLLKRSDTGQWAFPGGGIEKGETAEQAAMRESLEEMDEQPSGGIEPFATTTGHGVKFTTFRTMKPHQEFKPTLNSEHKAFKWASIEEALDMNLHPGVREILQ